MRTLWVATLFASLLAGCEAARPSEGTSTQDLSATCDLDPVSRGRLFTLGGRWVRVGEARSGELQRLTLGEVTQNPATALVTDELAATFERDVTAPCPANEAPEMACEGQRGGAMLSFDRGMGGVVPPSGMISFHDDPPAPLMPSARRDVYEIVGASATAICLNKMEADGPPFKMLRDETSSPSP
jgi:hypothetical protein